MSHIDEIELEPRTEGRTHIRLSATSRSLLGRLLANEAHTPFEIPKQGTFNSLEGYWAYVKSGAVANPLRALETGAHDVAGEAAVRLTIKTLRKDDPQFRAHICAALDAKIQQTSGLRQLIKENGLVLLRYEIIDGETFLQPNQKWFMDHLDQIVQRLKCRRPTTKTLRR